MKLATYQDGSPDGQLVVVSRDLGLAHYATGIANRMQQVLDDWNYLSPQLQDLYDALNAGRARHAFAFEPARCMAPLPRAYQWASSNAYTGHLALLHRAHGGTLPSQRHTHPSLTPEASDRQRGAQEPLQAAGPSGTVWGLDFGAQLAVITADIAQGSSAERALEGVRLIMLANGPCLRAIPQDVGHGEGDVVRLPHVCSPVVITPDALGDAWRKGRVHLSVQCTVNGRRVGLCDAASDMDFHFGQLIAHLARVRSVGAGSIVASGVISNQATEKKGTLSWPQGYCSIAAKRAMEILQDGQAATAFLQAGDTLRIEMKDAAGHSVFGAIAQEVA